MMVSFDAGKRLSSRFALDARFTVAAGITILFGASGSGKTTVLRLLAGLTRPDAGRIAIGDRALFDARSGVDLPVWERRVGYVFQQLALFPHMTLEQNIAYGLRRIPRARRRERVSAIAESFRIAGMLDRRPDRVSGGERQRAALARALVTDPAVLLLDEPLSALDHAIRSRIMDDLRRWNEARGIPILYVTHTHGEAFALGARVLVLEEGRVLASGSPHEVLDHPAHDVLASLAGFENLFDATVVDRPPGAGTMQCRLHGSATELEVPLHRSGEQIRVAIRAGDILVADHRPSGLSARNVLRGEIVELSARGPTMIASVDAGSRFVVHLTPGAVASLALRRGQQVWLVIKTYSCRVAAG